MREWLDKREYPFCANYSELPMGRMHCVDEGKSDHAVGMVYGNPTWSFLFRRLIRRLSPKYRCLVPDHIDFGRSDKSKQWDYLPKNHALNLEKLPGQLDLRSVTRFLLHYNQLDADCGFPCMQKQ